MQVCTPFRIRFSETDMMGIVYHANYLLYFEDARTHFLVEAGIPYTIIEEAGYMCPIRAVDMSFGLPLRYEDDAFVVTRICEIRPSQSIYEQRVFKGVHEPGILTEEDAASLEERYGSPVATAHVNCCIVETATFKPTTFKRALPDLYARCLEIEEREG